MKKLKVIILFPLSLILIYMFASGIYSKVSFEQRSREVKTFTEDQLRECIKENREKILARGSDSYGSYIHISSNASDRELWEAQCLYENDFVGRYFLPTN